jgi:hypothetical protein
MVGINGADQAPIPGRHEALRGIVAAVTPMYGYTAPTPMVGAADLSGGCNPEVWLHGTHPDGGNQWNQMLNSLRPAYLDLNGCNRRRNAGQIPGYGSWILQATASRFPLRQQLEMLSGLPRLPCCLSNHWLLV